MVFINEFLPNPAGSDVEGEWAELFNADSVSVDLTGWILGTKGGKKFSLDGKTIGTGEYLFLPRTETKLTLHNTDGTLALYDSTGKLVDEAQFLGTAPEGKSFSRIDQESDVNSQIFVFAEPTPGAKNSATNHLSLTTNNYSFGAPLNPQIGPPQIFGMAAGVGLALALLVMIVVLRNESLSKLLFKGDPEIR